MENLKAFNLNLAGKGPEDVLSWAIGHFGPDKVALASSLGAEDQVLTDMLLKIDPSAIVFTIDTGRLPQETLECLKDTEKKHSFKYHVYAPEVGAVKKMVAEKGLDLFYESVENRKLCCHIRKVEPLKRALQGLKVWICGLRREQSVTRADLNVIEWDEANGLYKINPLIDWTEKQVWDYVHAEKIPYNKLHDQGYPSIGCAPCTRAVKPGEDVRAGRWWWESPDKKECGLHFKDGKVVRKGS
ncbi:MAG: phosphoadenylyl-sulfate reductase [Candidatus Omnitrophota bacterium]